MSPVVRPPHPKFPPLTAAESSFTFSHLGHMIYCPQHLKTDPPPTTPEQFEAVFDALIAQFLEIVEIDPIASKKIKKISPWDRIRSFHNYITAPSKYLSLQHRWQKYQPDTQPFTKWLLISFGFHINPADKSKAKSKSNFSAKSSQRKSARAKYRPESAPPAAAPPRAEPEITLLLETQAVDLSSPALSPPPPSGLTAPPPKAPPPPYVPPPRTPELPPAEVLRLRRERQTRR